MEWHDVILKSDYVKPTKYTKQIMLLKYLIDNPFMTQRELASKLDLTPSQVNVYLQELSKRSLLIPVGNSRSRKYAITPEGRWFYRVGIFRITRDLGMLFVSTSEIFNHVRYKLEPFSRVVIYGAGDICQMLIPLLTIWGKDVVTVIDDLKQGNCMGKSIVSLSEITDYQRKDLLIIASFKNAEPMIRNVLGIWKGPIYRFSFDENFVKIDLEKVERS